VQRRLAPYDHAVALTARALQLNVCSVLQDQLVRGSSIPDTRGEIAPLCNEPVLFQRFSWWIPLADAHLPRWQCLPGTCVQDPRVRFMLISLRQVLATANHLRCRSQHTDCCRRSCTNQDAVLSAAAVPTIILRCLGIISCLRYASLQFMCWWVSMRMDGARHLQCKVITRAW
jgi:hypothetical protein